MNLLLKMSRKVMFCQCDWANICGGSKVKIKSSLSSFRLGVEFGGLVLNLVVWC